EENEDPDLEVESLLDLAGRHWLTLTLQGHYRSQSPDLIHFSNQHFYKNKLELLPNREWLNNKATSLEYIKESGVWENQTNLAEADRVAELIYQLVAQNPEKEIGVITFNQPQQMLVLDKIEERFDREKLPRPESLM